MCRTGGRRCPSSGGKQEGRTEADPGRTVTGPDGKVRASQAVIDRALADARAKAGGYQPVFNDADLIADGADPAARGDGMPDRMRRSMAQHEQSLFGGSGADDDAERYRRRAEQLNTSPDPVGLMRAEQLDRDTVAVDATAQRLIAERLTEMQES